MKNARQTLPPQRIRWHSVGLTLLLLLTLILAGCGGDEEADSPGSDAPTVAPTTVAAAPAQTDPTATPTPAAAPAQDTPAPVPTPGEVLPPGKVLKSFRATSESIFSTTYADGTVEEQTSSFVSTFVRTDGPFGFDESFEMTTLEATEAGGDAEKIVMISVGENTAMRVMGEQWAVTARDVDELSPSFEMFSGLPGEMGDILDDAKKIGDETLNGIKTTHYRVEEKSVFEAMLGTMMDESEGKLVQLGYDVWVAKEGGFAVKYQFVIEVEDALVTDDTGQEVSAPKMLMSSTYELTEINTPITIEWPADAPEPGQIDMPGFDPGQFPLPPETQVEASMFGITSLVSALSPEEVTAFYTDALTELGWTADGMAGFFNWSKGELTLSMVIGPDEEAGGSRITLMPGE